MSLLPTKYVPIEFSMLGVAALVLSEVRLNDTVSTLWERVSSLPQVRTFDRYADGLTLLFAAKLIDLRRGVLAPATSIRSWPS
jgi:hypothetical protein